MFLVNATGAERVGERPAMEPSVEDAIVERSVRAV